MRVLPYFTLFGLFGSLFAEEAKVQESKTIVTPQDGIYVGLGIVASNDKYDFSLNSFADVEPTYKTTDYRRNQRNYSGQMFIGYQMVAPFFAALEIGYTLNKASVEKLYSSDELPGADTYMSSANLSMKYGNDLTLKLKIGKSFSIGCGNSCRHITPYIVLGMHERSVEACFNYLKPSLTQGTVPGFDDFSFANHKMKNRKLGVVWGFGTSISLEKEFAVGFEYNFKKMGSLYEQKMLVQDMSSGGNRLDKENHPRYYSLQGKNTHTITIWVSKNISFN